MRCFSPESSFHVPGLSNGAPAAQTSQPGSCCTVKTALTSRHVGDSCETDWTTPVFVSCTRSENEASIDKLGLRLVTDRCRCASPFRPQHTANALFSMLAGIPQPLGLCPCGRARKTGSSLPQQAAVAAAVPLQVGTVRVATKHTTRLNQLQYSHRLTSPCRPCGTISTSATAAAEASPPNPNPNFHLSPFTQVPRQKQRSSNLFSTTATAAAADAAAYSTTQQLDGIVPYISSRAPQLKGRALAANPLQDLWQAASKAALRAELLLAALVDKHKFAPYFMSALAGVLLGTVSTCLDIKQLRQQQVEAAQLLRSPGLGCCPYCKSCASACCCTWLVLSCCFALVGIPPAAIMALLHCKHGPRETQQRAICSCYCPEDQLCYTPAPTCTYQPTHPPHPTPPLSSL
jgi:hypothetical protein